MSASPLHDAVLRRSLEAVNACLSDRADPDIPDDDGRTALHLAVVNEFVEAIDALAEAGADLNAQDRLVGHTPLHLVVGKSAVRAIQVLARHGADLHSTNWFGHTRCILPQASIQNSLWRR